MAGAPEDIVRVKKSYTGQFLAPVLARGCTVSTVDAQLFHE